MLLGPTRRKFFKFKPNLFPLKYRHNFFEFLYPEWKSSILSSLYSEKFKILFNSWKIEKSAFFQIQNLKTLELPIISTMGAAL